MNDNPWSEIVGLRHQADNHIETALRLTERATCWLLAVGINRHADYVAHKESRDYVRGLRKAAQLVAQEEEDNE